MDAILRPLNEQDLDLASIDIVVDTHLHGDHCGGRAPSVTGRRSRDGSGSGGRIRTYDIAVNSRLLYH